MRESASRQLPTGALREFWGEAAPSQAASIDEGPPDVASGQRAVAASDVELERPWCDCNVEPIADQAKLPPWAQHLFAGAWRRELLAWSRRLSPEQVAILAREVGPKCDKVARIIVTNNFDGSLCLAGGLPMLVERLGGLSRADLDASKVICRRLIESLQKGDVDASSYFDLLDTQSDAIMLQSFRRTPVEPLLRKALRPVQPRYIVHDPKEKESRNGWGRSGVKDMDMDLQQLWGTEPASESFRVASILDNGVVRQNMIYVREQSWFLLASVDFCQHGSAPPGHWHLNRTPTGERVEHWGPHGDVYHGSCWSCPLWWLVIPAGMDYRARPERLELLPVDTFGSLDGA